MGQEIEEYEEGDNCTHCWGAGKTFGDYPTPKRVYMTGSGFAGVFAPCNGKFIAEQSGTFPCTFSFDDGLVYGSWIVGPVNTAFIMGVVGEGDGYHKNEGLCKLSSSDAGKTVSIS